LLIAHIWPICSLFAPCQPGAALRDLGKASRFQGTRSIRWAAAPVRELIVDGSGNMSR